MTQPVRVRGDATQSARVEPPAAGGEEERVVRAGRELGPRVAEVAGEPVLRFLAEWDDAILVAFAMADVHELLLEVDVAEIEADGLGAPEACGVDELDERAVPDRQRAVAVEGA